MPIKNLSERERFPRLGKIHLGLPPSEGKNYPQKTDYFVLPKDSPGYADLVKLFGDKPKELRVMIPAEDVEIWASQYYKAYDLTHGLVCKGDGTTATRLVDVKTQQWPSKDAVATTMLDMPCAGPDCPEYKAKKCGEQMNLQVVIPEVPGLGVWQIDTGSKNSIININSCAKIIKMAFGRLSRIPLTLSLEPAEVKNPENGKRQTVYVLHLRANVTLAELATSAKAIDKSLLLTSPEFEAQLSEQVERDSEELWGGTETKSTEKGIEVKAIIKPEPPPAAPEAPKAAGKAAKGIPTPTTVEGQEKADVIDNDTGDRLITQAEISNIYKVLADNGMDTQKLGQWMRKDKNWTVKALKELTLNQYNAILGAFAKGSK